MIQRRIVKSPFTKEERQGVFVTREDSRKRRRNGLTKQRRTVDDKPKGYLPMTEQEFKEDLKYRMERDALHPHCDCPICQEAHKKFKEEPDAFLEEHWQDYLERKNYKPSEEELERRKAKLEEYRKKGWLV